MQKKDSMPQKEYYREVDGLRALAVLMVIFFHLNISGFTGGFIGVDVFFVISGYLITKLILEELSKSGGGGLWHVLYPASETDIPSIGVHSFCNLLHRCCDI